MSSSVRYVLLSIAALNQDGVPGSKNHIPTGRPERDRCERRTSARPARRAAAGAPAVPGSTCHGAPGADRSPAAADDHPSDAPRNRVLELVRRNRTVDGHERSSVTRETFVPDSVCSAFRRCRARDDALASRARQLGSSNRYALPFGITDTGIRRPLHLALVAPGTARIRRHLITAPEPDDTVAPTRSCGPVPRHAQPGHDGKREVPDCLPRC